MSEREIFIEMENTRAALELVRAMDPSDAEGVATMELRMKELTAELKSWRVRGAGAEGGA